MNTYVCSLKEKLTSLIREMAAAPTPYVKHPEKDFSRKKKLPFETVMQLLVSMGGNSLYKELLESQGYDVNTATSSAFVQQRNKILPSAFEYLFRSFTQSYTDIKDYRGYRLLAIDGSDLHIATDPTDSDTYFQSQPGTKGFNLLHLNAAYDLCNRLYVDALVQPRRLWNEGKALAAMVDRSPIKGKTIVVADRGYESYNNFAHLERKGWNYVIRVKAKRSWAIELKPQLAQAGWGLCRLYMAGFIGGSCRTLSSRASLGNMSCPQAPLHRIHPQDL